MTPAPSEVNHLGQPVGARLPHWKPVPRPAHQPMLGQHCRLEPLDPSRHAEALHQANSLHPEGRSWTYLPYGPFDSLPSYRAWLEQNCCGPDPLFFAIIGCASNQPSGTASFLRIDPANGSIEAGHINYSPRLQRSIAATEAMFLMMSRAFGLGYRRYEWKCDSLNAPSRAAAQRLGFSFEGVFRQAAVVKGRNRDTAWYSILDSEWPALRAAFLQWLDPANFTAEGEQRVRLSMLTGPLLKARG